MLELQSNCYDWINFHPNSIIMSRFGRNVHTFYLHSDIISLSQLTEWRSWSDDESNKREKKPNHLHSFRPKWIIFIVFSWIWIFFFYSNFEHFELMIFNKKRLNCINKCHNNLWITLFQRKKNTNSQFGMCWKKYRKMLIPMKLDSKLEYVLQLPFTGRLDVRV